MLLNKKYILIAIFAVFAMACSTTDEGQEKGAEGAVSETKDGESTEEAVDSMAEEIMAQQDVNVSANASKIYEKLCTNCHGTDGTLGKFGATDLSKSTMLLNDRIEIIKNGKGIMMAYSDQLSESEIEAVAFYLTNLRR